ncbi:MAG: nuclear transport factor 2 family protein [Pseudomonadota bacterium]|nr:nuclear transport factor 2 family protein [Pseudomonadota bacterium]
MTRRLLLVLAMLCVAACVPQRPSPQDAQRERLARLAAEVQAAEDVSAIKRLQRTYGYFLDKGLWTDLAEYFTEDAVASYPAGVFIGRESIRQHLYRNVGGVAVGQVGLAEGRLYNHMNLQPVVHLDPGGNSAKGRWRALAMFGTFGGAATWAEGIYEVQYRKVDGTWKISKLDYHAGFSAAYETGWVAPPEVPGSTAAPRSRRQLAHPPDRERSMECEGFPAACIAPFHYPNPGTPAGGRVWGQLQPAYAAAQFSGLAQLARRAERLQDEQQIENLQRIYGYYLDRAQWDQVADLFAEEGAIELGQQGLYQGKRRIREFLGTLGPHGLQPGWLNDHLQLQPVVTVIEDPRSGLLTARIRSRELGMTGHVNGKGQWSEGIYENWLVRENGVWKFSVVRFYPTFITDYDAGWAKDAQPAPAASTALPPDAPPSQRYAIYPRAHVPPFHYVNPASGQPVTYPAHAAAAVAVTPAVDKPTMPWIMPRQETVRDPAATLALAEQQVARVKDYHEIENLGSAYGYYLDKNLYNPLAELFARNGSIELAQRGVYRGANVRKFLLQVFGRSGEGPVAGRLGNHIQVQPVIHVAEDGRTASVRSRMLQQMSTGGQASIGGAIYANELVKEGGVWKFSKVHAYNTFSAGYEGGWARAASRNMPGPSAYVKPDAPPGTAIHMLPIVYEIPYHYANPVTGRTALPPLPLLAAQLAQFPPAPQGMPADVAAALREIGPRIEAQRTAELYAPLHAAKAHEGVEVRKELAYGPHERHRADVYLPKTAGAARPMVVFVHGGGFTRGAKSTAGQFYYDNIGYWAAENGLVGVTINYRLATQFPYPAGAEDVARAVDWLRSQAGAWGADPARIFLWGHSAGGAHVADYLVRTSRPAVAGAILTSGIYDLGGTVSTWKDYYGEDVSLYPQRSSLPRLARVPLPLLVSWAELDRPDFVADSEKLASARVAARTPTVTLTLPGHSHLSEAYAVGTADRSLTTPVLQFIQSPPR